MSDISTISGATTKLGHVSKIAAVYSRVTVGSPLISGGQTFAFVEFDLSAFTPGVISSATIAGNIDATTTSGATTKITSALALMGTLGSIHVEAATDQALWDAINAGPLYHGQADPLTGDFSFALDNTNSDLATLDDLRDTLGWVIFAFAITGDPAPDAKTLSRTTGLTLTCETTPLTDIAAAGHIFNRRRRG